MNDGFVSFRLLSNRDVDLPALLPRLHVAVGVLNLVEGRKHTVDLRLESPRLESFVEVVDGS